MKIKKLIKYSGFAIFLLLCLTLFTLSQVNDANSRYKSEMDGASSGTIAKWDVSLTPVTEGNTFNIIVGNSTSVDYTLKVSSNSQVSCNYTIVVSNVPNDIKVSLDNGAEQSPEGNTVTFTNAGSFVADDANTERTHTLSIRADLSTSAFNDDITINVTFNQIN